MYREFTQEESKWVKKLNDVMKKAPVTLFMFVGPSITIYVKDENNNRYMTDSGAVDGSATSKWIDTNIDFDGGDY